MLPIWAMFAPTLPCQAWLHWGLAGGQRRARGAHAPARTHTRTAEGWGDAAASPPGAGSSLGRARPQAAQFLPPAAPGTELGHPPAPAPASSASVPEPCCCCSRRFLWELGRKTRFSSEASASLAARAHAASCASTGLACIASTPCRCTSLRPGRAGTPDPSPEGMQRAAMGCLELVQRDGQLLPGMGWRHPARPTPHWTKQAEPRSQGFALTL